MKRSDWILRFAAAPVVGALALLCGLAVPQPARGASAYTLTPTANGMELKTPDGRVVFDYLTKKPAGVPLTSPSAACFQPVNTPSGIRVTNIAPVDHPHHRGIFFGWHDAEFHTPQGVVRADFWGWGRFAPRDGRVVDTKDVKLISADDKQAKIQIDNEWMVDGKKFGDEIDTATVMERDGVFVIDLEYRITPVYDYVAAVNPFGGFAVQGRRDGDFYYSNLYGKTTYAPSSMNFPGLNMPDFGWYDYSVDLLEIGKTVGATVIDHPDNGPTTWHLTVWMVNPSLTVEKPVTIKAGTTKVLKYRVVTHDGPPPTWVLQRLANEYRGGR